MKKAKIMLSAIGVIAVIGGALAFTAHKNDTVTYFICDTTPNTCTKSVTVHKAINLTSVDPGGSTRVEVDGARLTSSSVICSTDCPSTSSVFYNTTTNN